MEQIITEDWSHLVDDDYNNKTITKNQLEHFNNAWIVENLLSPEECLAIINRSEEIGYGEGSFNQFVRNNLRLQVISPELSKALWERIKLLFQEPIVYDNGNGDQKWYPTAVNSLWRLSKYNPGQFFQKHVDGYYEEEKGKQSFLTLNIYLNDNEAATRFYHGDGITRVEPKAGSALVFLQAPMADYLHMGEAVQSGVKYLLRSDIMFKSN